MEIDKATILQWRRFLNSEAGLKWALLLKTRTPGISTIGTSEQIILSAGIAEGYRRAIDTIVDVMTDSTPKDIKVDNE